ncbi:MAG: hypothetical protein ACC651_04965, partial [Candidatus Scalindua sp.]
KVWIHTSIKITDSLDIFWIHKRSHIQIRYPIDTKPDLTSLQLWINKYLTFSKSFMSFLSDVKDKGKILA